MMTNLTEAILVPRPLRIEAGAGAFVATPGTRVLPVPSGGEGVAEALLRDLSEACGAGHLCSPGGRIELVCGPPEGASPEAYTLTVSRDLVTIKASDVRGLFMGRATLRQLLIQGGGVVPCGRIADSPAFAHRGYMLDVSRSKVPSMDTLLALIEWLSQLKYNHFQIYIEHAFAYRNHRTVWENASPFTAEEIRRIDAFCRERFIGFVPNQNSLGHMEQWLRHPGYASLAECPEGFQDPWTPDWRTPCTLSPVLPGSLDLMEELYAELLPNFSGALFNVGCDEPFELGRGLSGGECGKRGKGRVYLDWLLALRRLCKGHGRRMLFWADIINEHPELVAELPKDMIPLEWGYEKGHPWDEHCACFAGAGLSFFVCPGTSTWNSISGRTDNAFANLREAAEAGIRHKALGYLVTEWGDSGHRQFQPINLLPQIAAACCAWNPDGFEESHMTRAVDLFVLRDAGGIMGRWLYDFGNLYLCDPSPPLNHSRFFMLLHHRDGPASAAGLQHGVFLEVLQRLDALEAGLASARLQCADAELVHDELVLSMDFLRHACHRGLALQSGRERECAGGLAAEFAPLITRYRGLWRRRNRPGGLDESVRLFDELLKYYLQNSGRCDAPPLDEPAGRGPG